MGRHDPHALEKDSIYLPAKTKGTKGSRAARLRTHHLFSDRRLTTRCARFLPAKTNSISAIAISQRTLSSLQDTTIHPRDLRRAICCLAALTGLETRITARNSQRALLLLLRPNNVLITYKHAHSPRFSVPQLRVFSPWVSTGSRMP